MTAALPERPERPTLATSAVVIDRDAGADDRDLADLVRFALAEHEPTGSHAEHPRCPSCDCPMPCAIWAYAELEARMWLFARTQVMVTDLHARIDRYEAATRLGRRPADLEVRTDLRCSRSSRRPPHDH